MMQKLQRFGGAMFTPVLLFAFAGIILSLSIMFQNEMLVGGIAVVPKILWKLPQITRWCEKPSPAIQSLVKQTLLTTEPMVFSFAVKDDGIQKEQHKVALGSENFKPLAIRIVKSTLRCLFS